MPRPRNLRWLAIPITATALTTLSLVYAKPAGARVMMRRPSFAGPFAMTTQPLAGRHAPMKERPAVSLSGSTIAALANGRALVIDADAAELVAVGKDGKARDRVAAGVEPALLALDRAHDRVYVSDRGADQIRVFGAESLRPLTTIATQTEPYGLALSPDGARLYVTAVAARSLTVYDTQTGNQLWTLGLPPEPRGVALSPDGKTALVTFLTQGSLARIDVTGAEPSVSWISLEGTAPSVRDQLERTGADSRQGRSFARAAFQVVFASTDVAIVGHQLSTPHEQMVGQERPSSYGGGAGFDPPVLQRVGFIGLDGSGVHTAFARIIQHQPRALAYDAAHDTLYVAGYGSDDLLAVGDATQATAHARFTAPIAPGCGPTGLAVADDGTVLAACELTRKVAVITPPANEGAGQQPQVALGPETSERKLSAAAERGRAIFRLPSTMVSEHGGLACATCHPEGRTDGLSWRIEGHDLQTPLLMGRLVGTDPFKWDGKDATLAASMTTTMKRLGGTGLGAAQTEDLMAYLISMKRPRVAPAKDPEAVARGRALFGSDATGCANCHEGKMFTDRVTHALAPDLGGKVDTPSLVGLAASAPYFHDGSAATLRAAILGNGSIHGMGKTDKLSETQLDDLVAYLETL